MINEAQGGAATGAPRICILVTSAKTATTFLNGYLSFFKQRGWAVSLVCSASEEVRQLAEREGVAFHGLDVEREPSPWSDLKAARKLHSIFRSVKPDVAWYATPKMSLLASMGAFLNRVPVRIYQQWGLRLETTTGPKRGMLYCTEFLTALMSTSIVANSRSLADKLLKLRLSAGKPVHVLGAGSSHGIDSWCYSSNTPFGSADKHTLAFIEEHRGLTIGFVGRIHPDKGVETLLRGAEIAHHESFAMKVLLVGKDEGASPKLDHQSAPLLPVHLTGEVADTRPYYALMDVLVLMSAREGFPNVVLEAASMGVPSIVSDSTGTVDSVLHDETGLIVAMGDVNALSRALISLAKNKCERRRLAIGARARVVEDFDQVTVWGLHEAFTRRELTRSAKQSHAL